jgi:hypothetical protein
MGAIELEWTYNGSKLNTIALVSDKQGIVYDNLLYFIHFADKNSAIEKKYVSIATPRLKSGSENSDGNFLCTIYKADEYYNFYGILVCKYMIECKIPYSRSNGQISINGYSSSKTSWAQIGWNCVADIQKKI